MKKLKIFFLIILSMNLSFANEQKISEDFTEKEYEQFKQHKEISDLLWKIIDEKKKAGEISFVQDGRKGWPGSNPFYSRTEEGFFLEFYYGTPSSLWTPWGEVKLVGSCEGGKVWDTIISEFFEHMDTQLYIPGEQTEIGYCGPVYKILKIDNKNLPEPLLKKGAYHKQYNEVKEKWEILEKKYKEEKDKLKKEMQQKNSKQSAS